MSYPLIQQIKQISFIIIMVSMFSIIIIPLSYCQIDNHVHLHEHNSNQQNSVLVVIKILLWIYC